VGAAAITTSAATNRMQIVNTRFIVFSSCTMPHVFCSALSEALNV